MFADYPRKRNRFAGRQNGRLASGAEIVSVGLSPDLWPSSRERLDRTGHRRADVGAVPTPNDESCHDDKLSAWYSCL
jgi:hypothetical protein